MSTEKQSYDTNARSTIDSAQDTLGKLHDRDVNDRLQIAYAVRGLFSKLLGAIGLENLQASMNPPTNGLDKGGVAAHIASSVNIGIQNPVNVSHRTGGKIQKKIPGKEI